MSSPWIHQCAANSRQGTLPTSFAGTLIAMAGSDRSNNHRDIGGGMADTVALLQQLGFGGYEARAYIALLQRSPLNGYELAKASGLPRSNIYPVLQKLEARGAVVRLEMPSGARYTPVPPQELMALLGNQFQHALDAAQRSLEALVVPAEDVYVQNLRGHTVLLDHAQTLLGAVNEPLLVNLVGWYIWHSIALATLLNDLNDRLERGLDPETRARLQAVGPSEQGGGWLAYMHQLLSQRRG